MTSKCLILAGPPGSGKTDRLLGRLREVLAHEQPGAAIYLAPTWRAAAAVRGRLLGGGCRGCFHPGVMTFDQFAEAVLEVAPLAARPIGRSMKRQLIRQLLRRQRGNGRLEHFDPIAETAGLADLVGEWISELKRLEIWPEHFRRACNARGITQKDVELLDVYEEYQRHLREHNLYDAEGRFWSARDRLGQGQRRPLDRLRLVVADGFADFTRTQHEILEILAGRVDELLISLPLEAETRRAELFAKPQKTLAELRRRHPDLVVEEMPRPERPAWPAMAHIESRLFGSPRHLVPAEDTAGVEVLATAGQLGEIEQIGSRIKRLLIEGDGTHGGRPPKADEIAVVFRSAEDTGPLVAEVFGALGIPFALEMGESLDRSPALAAVVALLRLDLDDWPFAQLLQVLTSTYFQPDWPEWHGGETAATAEQTIRRLQVPHGRRRLLGELQSPPCDGTRRTLALLERLATAFDELPRQAGPAGWADGLARLARQTGLLRAIRLDGDRPAAAEDDHRAVSDQRAWGRFQEALRAGDTLAKWLGEEPTPWTRPEALDAVVDILASERVGWAGDESGRVRVLSAPSARALTIPYLFLAGLSEMAFPPPQRVDRLYGEPEYQRLIDEGLPLVARTERNREEMLLFYETVTRATRRLYLSYPALDAAAQPLAASPFLVEVEQACGGRIRRTVAADLSPIPADEEPLSAAEFRIKAIATALEGDVSLLAGLISHQPAVAENVLAGLDLIELRRDREQFGPAEGVLAGEAARQRLAARFPADHTFSVTTLEAYASCPYRFFLERVLGLKPLADLLLEVDYGERGRLAHDVLASLHRRVNRSLGRPGSPLELDAAEYDGLLAEALEELLGGEIANPLRAALRQVDRRLLGQWTAAYRGQHERYDMLWSQYGDPLVPELFEVSFGRETGDEDPPSTSRPLEFLADGQPIRISGRIDRIDTGRVGSATVFNVVDYKTGSPLKFDRETIAAGTTLQLPLYALAAAELLLLQRDSVPWQAGYWYLKGKGFKQVMKMYTHGDESSDQGPVPTDAWEEIRMRLAETVAALVRGIRGGRFPVHSVDEQCTGRCGFATVCRINHVRALEKIWNPVPQNA